MHNRRSSASALAVLTLSLFAGASNAWADYVTFSNSNASGLAASVTFEVSGGNLIVTLTNTSSMDVTAPAQVLTGVFFSAPGSLTPVSANVAMGSSVIAPIPAGIGEGSDVGGEWAYLSGLSMSFGSNSGISSSGLGVFGPEDLFDTSGNLAGPTTPDGLQYGITSDGDDAATGNGGIAGTPLIQNSVVFVLSGWNEEWSLSDLANVVFQYGTSLDEPRLTAVPEPGVLALLGLGLVGLVLAGRRMSWA